MIILAGDIKTDPSQVEELGFVDKGYPQFD